MSSTEDTTINNTSTKKIVFEIPTYLSIYNDASIDRPRNIPRVPPSPNGDPATGVLSQDTVFSFNPLLSARLFLPELTRTQPNNDDQNNQKKLPILVYFHGGAFCFESAFAQHHHAYCNNVSSKANAIIVSVEHRKAPEHYLPAAYNDCWDALKWVASHATQNPTNDFIADPWLINHGDFSRIFIGGESSGANIVHNVAMRAGAEDLPNGVKLYGAYMNHPYFCGSEPVGSEPVEGYEQSLTYLVWNFVYPDAPCGIDNPMINPMAPGAPSLATLGCSKIFISVAGKDHLYMRDRGVMYYDAVKESGWNGEICLFEEPEEDHVYHMFNMDSNKAKILIRLVADFLGH